MAFGELVRNFDGEGWKVVASPGAVDLTGGGFTIAALVKVEQIEESTFQFLFTAMAAGKPVPTLAIKAPSNGELLMGLETPATLALAAVPYPSPAWIMIAVSKPAGEEIPRFYVYSFSEEELRDGGASVAVEDQSSVPDSLYFGSTGFPAHTHAEVAAIAVWGTALSEAEIKALYGAATLSEWNTLGPQGLWLFNQPVVEGPPGVFRPEALTDFTGNGADQTEIAGTESVNEVGGLPIPYLTPPAEPPSNVAAPVLSGMTRVGQKFSCSTGEWTNEPTAFGYQWQRSADGTTGWANIEGATASEYTLVKADEGSFIRCEVTAENAAGTSEPAVSEVKGAIAGGGEETPPPEEEGGGEEPPPGEEEGTEGEATFTFQTRLFPDGTAVGIYDATSFSTLPESGPQGKKLAQATVTGHTVTASGLASDHAYFAAAKLDGKWLAVRFIVNAQDPSYLHAKAGPPGPEGKQGPVGPPGREIFLDVTSSAYGAKGNGETDDTAAIQKALDAAKDTGGVVFLPAGTYATLSPLILHSGMQLRGAGEQVSTIKASSAVNDDAVVSDGFDTLTGSGSTGGIHDFAVSDLTIEGRQLSEAHGLKLYGYRFRLENLRVKGGIYSEWSSEPNLGAVDDRDVEAFVSNVRAYGAVGICIDWRGPHDSQFSNVFTVATEETTRGLSFSGNGYTCQVVNLHTWGKYDEYGLYCGAGTGAQYIVNAQLEGGTLAQAFLGDAKCVLLGGEVFDGDYGVAEVVGIEIGAEGFGSYVDTYWNGCDVAIKFTGNGGGSVIKGVVNGSEGSVVSGSVDETVRFDLAVASGVTDNRPAPAVEAAAKLELPPSQNYLSVFGEATIEEVVPTHAGHIVTLRFTGTAKVKDAFPQNLNEDFDAAAGGSTLTLCCDGEEWNEVSRSLN